MPKIWTLMHEAISRLQTTNNMTRSNFKAEVQMRVNKFSSLLIHDDDLNRAYDMFTDLGQDRVHDIAALCSRLDKQIEVQSRIDTDKATNPPKQDIGKNVVNLFGGGRSDDKFNGTKSGNMTPMELAHTLPSEIRENEFESLYVIGIKPDGLQVKYSVGPHFHLEAQAMKELLYHMEMVRSWIYGAEHL